MILNKLKEIFSAAFDSLGVVASDYLDSIRPAANKNFGDYQANCAMALARQLGEPPRQVAQRIVEKLDCGDFLEKPEIAGPGFINLKITDRWLAKMAQNSLTDERLGVATVATPKRILIDFSAPNVAKPMHVGHIRSTVIGNALARILRFRGHRVLTDNHLGDWGTQFGMIIYGFRHFLDRQQWEENPVSELARLYRLVRQLIDLNTESADLSKKATASPEVAAIATAHQNIGEQVLLETSKLHHDDAENLRLWQEFMPFCLKDIDRIYDRLGITFDTALGESFYNNKLQPLVDRLLESRLATISQGAVCIFLPGEEVPMLIRKKDGAFLYATTDLATIEYRINDWKPDQILYVVDFRQSHHFEQLFAAARLIGWNVDLVHVKFGTVLGEDGRPFKTRSGDSVGLESLLDEAYFRAAKIVCENDDAHKDGPQLSAEQRNETAERIGMGALVYADLAQNRESDYIFSYDKMLAMNGNTATYMQYAFARISSIFDKGKVDTQELIAMAIAANESGKVLIEIDDPSSRDLIISLLRFSEALEAVEKDFRPNQLTAYLFALANDYSAFFERCPVLKAESAKISRLLLCAFTARTIRQGLTLLGIQTVDRM